MHTYRRALYTLWSGDGNRSWIWCICHQLPRHWAIVDPIWRDSSPCSTTINSRGQHLNSRHCFSLPWIKEYSDHTQKLFRDKQNLKVESHLEYGVIRSVLHLAIWYTWLFLESLCFGWLPTPCGLTRTYINVHIYSIHHWSPVLERENRKDVNTVWFHQTQRSPR